MAVIWLATSLRYLNWRFLSLNCSISFLFVIRTLSANTSRLYIYLVLFLVHFINCGVWYDMIDMIWYMIYDIWYMIYDIWYMIYDMMIWNDMIWYDWNDMIWLIWYDMIWYDVIWYMIWYDMIWLVWYDMIWYDMKWLIWYGIIWVIYLQLTVGYLLIKFLIKNLGQLLAI